LSDSGAEFVFLVKDKWDFQNITNDRGDMSLRAINFFPMVTIGGIYRQRGVWGKYYLCSL